MYGTPQTAIGGSLGSSFQNMTAREVTAATSPALSPVANGLATQEQVLTELHQVLDMLQTKLAPCLAPSVQGTGTDTPGKPPLESPLVQALERHNGQLVIAVQRLRAMIEAAQL